MSKLRILSSLVLLLFLQLNGIAQKKKISLEEAILQQNSDLAPKSLKGMDWIPKSDLFTMVESGELKIKPIAPDGEVKSIDKEDFEGLVGDKLNSIPSVNWISKDECYFRHKNTFYTINVSSKKGKKIAELPEKVKSVEVEENTMTIAFTKDNNLFVKKLNEEAQRVSTDGSRELVYGEAVHRFEFGISKGMFWSPDGLKLAYYKNNQSMVQDYPLTDITTTPASLNNIKYPMAGSDNEEVSLEVFDVKTGEVITLKTDNGFDYLTNISWGPEGKLIYIALLNRGQDHMKLNTYSSTTGEFVTTLLEEIKSTYVEPLFPPQFIPGKGREFLWLSKRGAFHQIYHYSKDGELVSGPSENNFEITEFLGFDADGKRAFFTGTGPNPTESNLFSYNLDSKTITQLTEKPGTHRSMVSASGKYFLDAYSSLEVPGRYMLKSTESTKKEVNRLLLEAENPLKNFSMPKTEIFTIKSANGDDLYCRSILPSNFDESEKYPVLIYVYNGPHVQLITNSWLGGARLWMHYMAEKGYIVFTVDGRGSSNRGTAFEEVVHRNLGVHEIEDQLSGVDYLKSLKYVDADRMAVHGWSFGGFMTTSLMLKQPGVFNVGVAGGPVTDWKFYEIMYTERYMDSPEENKEGYARSSLLDKVGNLKGKLLLIHGLVDDVVVPQQNLSLVREAVKEGVQLDFFPYPTHPHNVRGKDRLHLMRKVLDYVEENN